MACFRGGSVSRALIAVSAIVLAAASFPARSAKPVPTFPGSAQSVARNEGGRSADRTPVDDPRSPAGPRGPARHPREHLRWIVASRRDELELVDIADVRFFKSDNKYTRVATADRDLLIRKTIRELAESLDPEVFWQVHRAVIVNIGMVKSVSHGADGKLVVRLKDRPEELHVSQPYARRFHRM